MGYLTLRCNSLVETASTAEEPSQREKVENIVLPQPSAGTASEEQIRGSPKANHKPHRFENSVSRKLWNTSVDFRWAVSDVTGALL